MSPRWPHLLRLNQRDRSRDRANKSLGSYKFTTDSAKEKKAMRIFTVALVALMFAMGAAARPKDEAPQYKTAEAKHFATAEGVELSPAFVDYFYAELRNELTKGKLVKEVIGEGEAVEDADAPKSLVIS